MKIFFNIITLEMYRNNCLITSGKYSFIIFYSIGGQTI